MRLARNVKGSGAANSKNVIIVAIASSALVIEDPINIRIEGTIEDSWRIYELERNAWLILTKNNVVDRDIGHRVG